VAQHTDSAAEKFIGNKLVDNLQVICLLEADIT
jgi:hypothetical protein